MIDGIELFYQQIAESMPEAIPEEWSTATFQAIFFPDGSIYEAEYIRKVDGVARGFQPTSAGSKAFRQLRKAFKDAGKPVWGSARFELFPDGKFDMTWNYDHCDENGNTHFNEDEEVRRREERRKRLTAP